MDDFERRCLFNCRHYFYRDVNIHDLVEKLKRNGIISEGRLKEIEEGKNEKEFTANVLQYLSFKNEDCFQLVVQTIKEDYPELANRIELELLKERTSFSKDINDGLIEIINKQLLPIVYGKNAVSKKTDKKSQETPQESLVRLAELVKRLKLQCLRILGVKPSELKQTSLPALINKRIKEQQLAISQLKADIKEIKDLPKKNKLMEGKEEVTPSEKVFYLRKDLQECHERTRQLRLTLRAKEEKAKELKHDNATILKEIEDIRQRTGYGKIDVNLLFDG